MQRIIYSEVMAEYRTPGLFNPNGIWQIGPMLIAWGTEEQKQRWLPSILEAHEHWCQGFSEPDAGNDLANLRTTAIRDGDHYVVNGQKIWISTAHLARWGLFLLRTDPTAIERGAKHEGITAFIVDMQTDGIETRPIRDMSGEEMFNEVFFDDAALRADSRLGGEGEGWMVAMGTLGHERVGIASADLDPLRRPPGDGDRGAVGQPRGTRRPRAPRPDRPRVDRHRAGPAAVAPSPEQDHQGREELARGALRQTGVVVARPDPRRAGGRPPRTGRRARAWAGPTRSTAASGPGSTPSSATAQSAAVRPRCRRTSSPTGRSSCPARPACPEDACRPIRRAPCIIGAARRTWREVPAPEPLDLWEAVARAAAADAGASGALTGLESLQVVYCQSWEYDDPCRRLAERLGADPAHRRYSGIGGSVPLTLVADAAEAMARGELDLALVVGAEALATRRARSGACVVVPSRGADPVPDHDRARTRHDTASSRRT